MSVIDQNLLADEKIVRRTRHHKAVFVVPSLAVFVASLAVYKAMRGDEATAFFVLGLIIGFASFLGGLLRYLSFEAVISTKRVLTQVGLIGRQCNEILFTKVEAIDIQQGLLGRLMDYGKIVITGTGGSKTSMVFIPGPFAFRKALQQQAATSQANHPARQPVAV